jgi:hypothetical protein
MARKGNKPQPASAPAEDVEHEIAAVAAMDVYHLRELWIGKSPIGRRK